MAITSADPSQKTYEWAREAERAIVFYAASSAGFWQAGGQFIRPALVGADEAKLILTAMHEIAKEGAHPGHSMVVIQRLHVTAREGGRITGAELARCAAYLGDIEVDELPSEEALLREIVPTLKRQMKAETAKATFNAVSKSGEEADEAWEKVEQTVAAHNRVGGALRETQATTIDEFMLDGVPLQARTPRMSSHIPELDRILGGGFSFGEEWFVLGSSGEGKSTFAEQLYAAARDQGLFTGYATLEMDPYNLKLRYAGQKTQIPTRAIAEGGEAWEEAKRRLQWLARNKQTGIGRMQYFESTISTLSDIWGWVEEEERRYKKRMDVLFIDADEHVSYADLMKRGDLNDYKGSGMLYGAGLRWARGSKDPEKHPELKRLLIWTCQAKIGKKKRNGQIKNHEDGADSSKKGKIADGAVTINTRGEGNSLVVLNVSKDRNGDVGLTPELETNFPMSQLVKVVDPDTPWGSERKIWTVPDQIEIDVMRLSGNVR